MLAKKGKRKAASGVDRPEGSTLLQFELNLVQEECFGNLLDIEINPEGVSFFGLQGTDHVNRPIARGSLLIDNKGQGRVLGKEVAEDNLSLRMTENALTTGKVQIYVWAEVFGHLLGTARSDCFGYFVGNGRGLFHRSILRDSCSGK